MRFLYYILFWISPMICFSQFDLKEVVKNECVTTYPTSYTVYENPNNFPSYRSLKNDFIELYEDYDSRYWTIANYVYPTAEDAYNDTNAYERNVIARLVEFEISLPAVFYLRLDENLLNNPRRVVIKYVVNYSIKPPIRYDFDVIGCKLDENLNTFNLNKALGDIYGENYQYIFTFYRNQQDAMLGQNPIPEFEWENYEVSNSENRVFLNVKYISDVVDSYCFSVYHLNLVVKDLAVYVENNELTYCGVPYEIDGPYDLNNVYQFSNFQWFHNGILKSNDFSVLIDDLGEWEVFFDVNSGCRSSIKINVVPESGSNYIKDVRSSMTQIFVEPFDFNLVSQYSNDGINWQTSNVFNNSTDLLFTLYIKNSLGCIFGPFTYDVSNFFTFLSPNSDGINEMWDIRSNLKLDEYNYTLQIFNRHGKVLVEGDLKDILPWDGKYNNQKLPSGTYWYRIFKENNEVKTGSLLLKNQ